MSNTQNDRQLALPVWSESHHITTNDKAVNVTTLLKDGVGNNTEYNPELFKTDGVLTPGVQVNVSVCTAIRHIHTSMHSWITLTCARAMQITTRGTTSMAT